MKKGKIFLKKEKNFLGNTYFSSQTDVGTKISKNFDLSPINFLISIKQLIFVAVKGGLIRRVACRGLLHTSPCSHRCKFFHFPDW